MGEHHSKESIEPEVAGHLAESIDEVPGPESKRPEPPSPAEGQQWPDGSGKHRHPKEHDTKHGRAAQEAAVNAVHRTGKPDLPHSS
jgi:hypothetical protein